MFLTGEMCYGKPNKGNQVIPWTSQALSAARFGGI